MKYVHVKNLEKYHPGYKDRKLQWAKIMFNMVQGDPDCEMIENEIDWARLIKFIILELQAQKPIPLDPQYLTKKGFDLKKRSIQFTIEMLHNFIDLVTQDSKVCVLEGEVEGEKKESREDYSAFEKRTVTDWNLFCDKFPEHPKIKEISEKRRFKLKRLFRSKTFNDFQAILTAIQEQPFCRGENDRKWRVSFDWLIENDTNFLKVLERKYLNGQRIPEVLEKYRKQA